MRIFQRDIKRGLIKLAPTSIDDLFLLYQIIRKGDLVTTLTERKIEVGERKEKIRKKTRLTIKVKEVDLKRWVNVLRISGKIVNAPEDISLGTHHSFNIQENKEIKIQKENWKNYQIERLEKAKIEEPTILVAALDEHNSGFGIVRRFKIEKKGEIRSYISGKQKGGDREEKMRNYFGRIAKRIKEKEGEVEKIIIAGPGFTKNNFSKFLFEKKPGIREKTIVESVSYGGEAGIREILRRGIVQKILKESQLAKEVEVVNDFFKKLSKTPRLVKYGIEKVKSVAEYGAIEKLVLTDDLLRKEKNEVEKIIEQVQQKGGEFYIISTQHEGGKRLKELKGIGAILRYKM